MRAGCCTLPPLQARRRWASTARSAACAQAKRPTSSICVPPTEASSKSVLQRATSPEQVLGAALRAGWSGKRARGPRRWLGCVPGMTLGELNAYDRRRLRAGTRLDLRRFALGCRASMGPSALCVGRRSACSDGGRGRSGDRERAAGAAPRASRSRDARTHERRLRSANSRALASIALTRSELEQLQRLNADVSAQVRLPVSVCREREHEARCPYRARTSSAAEPGAERMEALRQVFRIARFRLEELIGG